MDAVYRDLEREVLRSPGDAGLRERIRQARRRIFGFDWEDPVVATARDVCTTTSLALVDVPSLDIAREIAKRPPQLWLVQFSAEVQPQSVPLPATASDPDVNRRQRPPMLAIEARINNESITFESRLSAWHRDVEWSTVSVATQLTPAMTFVSVRWRTTTHRTATIRTRSVVATPVCPVPPTGA